MTSDCPQWCVRDPRTHSDDWIYHSSAHARAGRSYAVLMGHVHGLDSIEARVMVSHQAAAGFVSIPVADAPGLADLMAALGHKGLAAAIRTTAAQAQPEAEAGS